MNDQDHDVPAAAHQGYLQYLQLRNCIEQQNRQQTLRLQQQQQQQQRNSPPTHSRLPHAEHPPTMPQFILSTHGHAEIPHPAERAVLHVAVASTGPNKASVSDEVTTTAQHIERLCRELSPADPDPSPSAKAAAPLAHWSKTGLSATSFQPYTTPPAKNGGPAPHQKARQYTARLTFDIRFAQFAPMGAFATRLAALPHTELSRIEWILTSATHAAHQSQLRRDAARDALEKARDYCGVLHCGEPRARELQEGNVAMGTSGGGLFGTAGMRQNTSNAMMQSAPGMGGGGGGGGDARDESPLEFTPKEVRMALDVTVKFGADPDAASTATTAGNGSPEPGASLAKRPRVEMEE